MSKALASSGHRSAAKYVRWPKNAAQAMALNRDDLERLVMQVGFRLIDLKRERAQLLQKASFDVGKLQHINAQIAWAGGIYALLMTRRTSLRVADRKAVGVPPDHGQALAIAADRLLSPKLHQRLMVEAEMILQSWAKDLATPDLEVA